MNARPTLLACLACLLFASLAFAAPLPSATAAEPAIEAPADVFGVSVLSPAGDCQAAAPKAEVGTLDPTQKCGACSMNGCKLNWIGVECGTSPGGPKFCEPTGGTCHPDGGAICRCQVPG